MLYPTCILMAGSPTAPCVPAHSPVMPQVRCRVCSHAFGVSSTQPPTPIPVAAQAKTLPWSQVATLTANIQLSLTPFKSPVLPVFIVPTSLYFFLFHFSTTYLLLVVPGVSEGLGSSQEWCQSGSCFWLTLAPRTGFFKFLACSLSWEPIWACLEPDWWPSQASFVFQTMHHSGVHRSEH